MGRWRGEKGESERERRGVREYGWREWPAHF